MNNVFFTFRNLSILLMGSLVHYTIRIVIVCHRRSFRVDAVLMMLCDCVTRVIFLCSVYT